MLDAGAHRQRRGHLAAVEEHGGTGDPQHRWPVAVEAVDELAQRALLLLARAVTIWRPRCQVVKTVNTMTADQQRQPRAVLDLVALAARNSRSTSSKARRRPRQPQRCRHR